MRKVSRRRRWSAAEAAIRADKLEARANDPKSPDDPAWLKRRVEAARRWSARRERARIRKIESRRKERRKDQH